MVRDLDAGLANLARCIRRDLGMDVLTRRGAGAAGGFGAGAVAFFAAELTPGVEAVADACGLRHALAGTDWVITGEGRFDEQSLQGKVVCGVRNHAAQTGTRVAVLAGRVSVSPRQWRQAGIEAVVACARPDLPDAEAFRQAEPLLAAGTRRLSRRIARLGRPTPRDVPSG
jgi:glycerate kinase